MRLAAFLLAVFLAGCVSDGRNLQPGVADAAAVRAEMGPPAEVLKTVQGGELWFYPRGRVGRQTFRVELGPDGRRGGILSEGSIDYPIEQFGNRTFNADLLLGRVFDGDNSRSDLSCDLRRLSD